MLRKFDDEYRPLTGTGFRHRTLYIFVQSGLFNLQNLSENAESLWFCVSGFSVDERMYVHFR